MKYLLTLILLLTSSFAMAADQIDIKGFHLGMTFHQFINHISDFTWYEHHVPWAHGPRFTIGGVPVKVRNPGCKHQMGCALIGVGTIDWFGFKFDASGYDAVKAAVMEKYPETKCDADKCVYITATERLTVEPGVLTVEVNDTPATTTQKPISDTAKKDL
jgi:hypothetical protein